MQKYLLLICLLSTQFAYSFNQLDKDSLFKYIEQFIYESNIETSDSLILSVEKNIENSTYKNNFKLELDYLKALSFERENRLYKSLAILKELNELALKQKEYSLAFKSHILTALVFEKMGNLETCFKYLNLAKEIADNANLDPLLGFYYVRLSSYYRFVSKYDSVKQYALLAIKHGETYNDLNSLSDGYLLMGNTIERNDSNDISKSKYYYKKAADIYLKQNKKKAASYMFFNIANIYFDFNLQTKSTLYLDSAYLLLSNKKQYALHPLHRLKAELFAVNNQYDSAFIFLKKAFEDFIESDKNMQISETINLEEKFESEKKQALINLQEKENKLQKIVLFLVCMLLLLVLVSFYFAMKANRKLKHKNKTIYEQSNLLLEGLKEKELLLKEIHHRVKNNLQIISGLLEFQRSTIQNEQAKLILQESQNRLQSMAIVHKHLYEYTSFSEIDIQVFLEDLTHSISNTLKFVIKDIQFSIKANHIKLDIETSIPLALIINELVTNSLKYAFINKNEGIISIELVKKADKDYKLTVKDNGIGMPTNFELKDIQTLGLDLVSGLAKQLNGHVRVINENGALFSIAFKLA